MACQTDLVLLLTGGVDTLGTGSALGRTDLADDVAGILA